MAYPKPQNNRLLQLAVRAPSATRTFKVAIPTPYNSSPFVFPYMSSDSVFEFPAVHGTPVKFSDQNAFGVLRYLPVVSDFRNTISKVARVN